MAAMNTIVLVRDVSLPRRCGNETTMTSFARSTRDALASHAAFLAGGGEMGAFMRTFYWAASPLGPTADWPPSLRMAVSLCLISQFSTMIFWGPDLIILYNDEI